MNILFFSRVSTFFPGRIGGAETSMALMAEKMAELGHKVFYLTYVEKDELIDQSSLEQFKPVQIIPYSVPRRVRKLLFKVKPGRKERRSHFEKCVAELMDRENIEILYSHYDREALGAFLKVREAHDFKLVMRMAGLKWYEESQDSDQIKADYEAIFRNVDAINYNTPGLKTLCHQRAGEISFDLSPRHEFVADIGARAVPVQHETQEQNEDVLSVTVATRFSGYQKRQDILVKAVALLDRSVKIQVTMIGSGSELGTIESMIEDLGVSDQINIIPFMPQRDLWQQLCQSDLLCHPCEYEGLSKIIVESMLLGLPVMVSDVLPLSDYVVDGETGYLVENTPEAWCRQLTQAYSERSSLSALGEQAKAYAEDAFDVDRNTANYLNEFQRIPV